MPVIGLRAEVVGQPGEFLRRRVGHVGVDGDLDEIGADDVGSGLEDDGDGGEDRLQLVGAKVGQQAAHESAVVGLADDIVVVRRLLCGFLVRLFGFLLVCHLSVSILDGLEVEEDSEENTTVPWG